PRKRSQDIFYLGSRYVLAMPAKRIAEPVDELRVLAADITHQIAGVEPGIAFLEDVAKDRRFAFGRVGIAVEGPFLADFTEQQPGFAFICLEHESLAVTQGSILVQVVTDDGIGGRGETYGVVEIEDIGKADVAFAGGIELGNTPNTEALFEFVPDRRA